jgi:glutathione synthase/RimK-type ligase-like ATP-grasp enzyme
MSHDSDLVGLFQEIAPTIGAKLTIEPSYRSSGMLEFRNGSVLFFRNNHLNINVTGNVRMVADKAFLSTFLAGLGFAVLPETTVSRHDIDRGVIAPARLEQVLQFAAKNGWRTVVKPNSLSQGRGVRVTLDREQLLGAVSDTLAIDRVCIVQQYCAMPEYRLVVLKGSVLQAYRRQPMTVTGDGSSTISELVKRKTAALSTDRGEDGDPGAWSTATRILASSGRLMSQAAAAGENIVVADIANLSAGGEAVDVINSLHPRWTALAIELTRKCGLLLCGIDIFIDDITDGDSNYRVIELNSAPGLDDYLLQGDAQRQRVLALYQDVLEAAATAIFAAATN